jgi:hypothetical protein
VVNAPSVVVTAQSRERVKLHMVVVYRMVVHMAVEAAVPTEAVALALVAVAIAVAEVAFVVDTGGEVVHFVATVELTPRRYVVALVAVDVLGLVEVASSIPLQRCTIDACVYVVQRNP